MQQEPVVMAQLPSPPTKEVILVEDVEAEVAAVTTASALRLRKFESRLALLESQVNSLLRKCQTQIGNNAAAAVLFRNLGCFIKLTTYRNASTF